MDRNRALVSVLLLPAVDLPHEPRIDAERENRRVAIDIGKRGSFILTCAEDFDLITFAGELWVRTSTTATAAWSIDDSHWDTQMVPAGVYRLVTVKYGRTSRKWRVRGYTLL